MMLTLRIPQTTDYSHLAIIFTTVLSQVYSEIFNIPIPPPHPKKRFKQQLMFGISAEGLSGSCEQVRKSEDHS